jgi:hypothetical protein
MRKLIITVLTLLAIIACGCSRAPEVAAPPQEVHEQAATDDPEAVLRAHDVPLYPGARPVLGMSAATLQIPEGAAHTTAWLSKDAAEKVIGFYKAHLKNPIVEPQQKMMVLGTTRSGESVTVVTSPDVGTTRITISVRPK